MSVQELRLFTDAAPQWSGACAIEHGLQAKRGSVGQVIARGARPSPAGSPYRVRPRPASAVRPRPAITVRACRVDAPPRGGVVDDVPTWALLVCGIVVGVLMLLALAFLGGPTYS